MRAVRFGVIVLCCFVFMTAVLSMSTNVATALNGPDADSCSVLIQNVFATVGSACSAAGINSACYAADGVQVKTTTTDPVTFAAKSDTIDLSKVQSLITTAPDAVKSTLGVSVLKIQADLPDDSKGVTGILFGDATLTSDVHPEAAKLTTLPVKTLDADPVLLRTAAGSNYPAATRLTAGVDAGADGRSADGKWIRVRVSKGLGWAAASQVTVTGDIQSLSVLDPLDTTPYFLYPETMQAFTLATAAATGSSCSQVSAGLLLQSSDKQIVHFLVNGTALEFAAATVFLQATPKDTLQVGIITGTATVRAQGGEVTLNTGDAVQVKLGGKDGLMASAQPKAKTSLAFAKINGVPTAALPDVLPCTTGVLPTDKSVTARSGPGAKDYGPLFFLRADQVYPVTGYAAAPDGGLWWKLTANGKEDGWVDKSAVQTLGGCDQVAKVDAAAPVVASNTSGSSTDPAGASNPATFAPSAKTIWNTVPTGDTLEGTCTIGALNYCSLLVAITPQSSGMLWKAQEIKPYLLTHVKDNIYAGGGRNGAGDGKLTIVLQFTSPTTFSASQTLILDAEPTCKHIHVFNGSLN